MPKPRSQKISLVDRPYYRICSRRVRKVFYVESIRKQGGSFEHRRTWIEKRLFQLAEVFSIDICAHMGLQRTHAIVNVE